MEQVTQTKRCINCGETKEVSKFYKSKLSEDGYQEKCRQCHQQHNAEVPTLPIGYIKGLLNLPGRDKLTFEYLVSIIATTCPVYGLTLVYSRSKKFNPAKATLDRIVPGSEGGLYVPGNVRWVSLKANVDRKDLTVEELRLLLEDAERCRS